MIIVIKKDVAEKIGFKEFKQFGLPAEKWSYRGAADLSLAGLNKKQTLALVALFSKHPGVFGVKRILHDISIWQEAVKDAASVKPRTIRQFADVLKKFLSTVPRHHIYQKTKDGLWLPCYVNYIEFHPEQNTREYRKPAMVSMDIIFEKFGTNHTTRIMWVAGDCEHRTVTTALAEQDFYPETPELRKAHLDEISRYSDIYDKIGEQHLATGFATDEMDGNPEGRGDRWYWRHVHILPMEREGSPTRCVIDIFEESPEEDRHSREAEPNRYFWKKSKTVVDSDEDSDDDEEDLDHDEDPPQPEIPIHPYIAIFDLARQLRLRIHVNNLKKYVYDKKLREKLILPSEMKNLVELLIGSKAVFQDIVKGKSGGSVVLLTGKPGIGKTLTAEVYAEAEERPLYTVQCSQLGTDPEYIEDALLKVFARARRWNAILLIDEADVYVHTRGNDLQQNAIVGVFLRILEYQTSVLFLTTNRPEDVDDAIASRCIARLNYANPSVEDQEKIWAILGAGTDRAITPATIKKIVKNNPNLSGRDIKNFLKLAQLMPSTKKTGITPEAVEFIKQFKPTN